MLIKAAYEILSMFFPSDQNVWISHVTRGTWPWMILTVTNFNTLANIFPSSEDINTVICKHVQFKNVSLKHEMNRGFEVGRWAKIGICI